MGRAIWKVMRVHGWSSQALPLPGLGLLAGCKSASHPLQLASLILPPLPPVMMPPSLEGQGRPRLSPRKLWTSWPLHRPGEGPGV